MDLIAYVPEFNLYNSQWPIYTNIGSLPPAKFVHSGQDRVGHATDSIVSPGVIVSGGEVHHSVLSPNVHIHSWAQVVDSILFNNVIVNRRARIYKAIIDKNVVLEENATVGIDTQHDIERGFTVTAEGITVVPKGTVVKD
jgi:glucose-1-phosphate adenylyltransferase